MIGKRPDNVIWKDERAFSHYISWECLAAGMYAMREDESIVQKSVELLSSVNDFSGACHAVASNWPTSARVFLTDSSRNRNAWLGRAACCLVHGASEYEVRTAWWRLTQEQQDEANEIATNFIIWICDQWKKEIYPQQNAQLEFQF